MTADSLNTHTQLTFHHYGVRNHKKIRSLNKHIERFVSNFNHSLQAHNFLSVCITRQILNCVLTVLAYMKKTKIKKIYILKKLLGLIFKS